MGRRVRVLAHRKMLTTAVGVAANSDTDAAVDQTPQSAQRISTIHESKIQLATVVTWPSSVAVAIGTIVGVPLGIVLERVLWDLFAREAHAVPAPSVPVLSVVVIALRALVLANVVVALPGRIAGGTRTALLLRAD